MLVGIEGKIGGNARSSGAHRSPETAASRSGLGVLACAHQYTQSETTVHGSPPRLQLPPPRLSLLLHFRKDCYSGARSGKDFCHLSILPFSPFLSASRMINIGHRRCQGHRWNAFYCGSLWLKNKYFHFAKIQVCGVSEFRKNLKTPFLFWVLINEWDFWLGFSINVQ